MLRGLFKLFLLRRLWRMFRGGDDAPRRRP